MKLNPFRRKTSGYFDKIKADYAERTRELEALRREAPVIFRDRMVAICKQGSMNQ